MNALLERLFRTYRFTGVPRVAQQTRDLAEAARLDHEEREARLIATVNAWRPTSRGYIVEEQ